MQLTDHDWMVAVAQGNLTAMSPIYESRHRALFRFFFRLTGRQTTSEDLAHEVFAHDPLSAFLRSRQRRGIASCRIRL
jgi:DNA-directed RNA polymerase specialized sigma24 family protein